MATVAITQDPSVEKAIGAALAHMPLESLVRGKLVAVKPNDTYATAQEAGAVTQPDTLRAVLREVNRWRPREVVVTGGAGASKTADVFRIAGLLPVVEQEGAKFFDHNRPPLVPVDLVYARASNVSGRPSSIMVNSRVLEYETLIAVNQLKMHASATVTLSLKNIAMSYPAADYYGYPRGKGKHAHQFLDDLHAFIAAMAKRFPIQLAITVGHPAMIGTGPLGGHLVETGLVIASTDPLAADAVGAKLLGFDLQAVRHLWEAAKLGVGESDFHKMIFPALSIRDAIGAFTSAAYGHRLTFE
jgi:uncharacterized protein (DUF362 family)